MKRIIRNKASGGFLTAKGFWTASVDEAESFASIDAVISAEQSLNLDGVELLLVFGEKPSNFDVVLPLGTPTESP